MGGVSGGHLRSEGEGWPLALLVLTPEQRVLSRQQVALQSKLTGRAQASSRGVRRPPTARRTVCSPEKGSSFQLQLDV